MLCLPKKENKEKKTSNTRPCSQYVKGCCSGPNSCSSSGEDLSSSSSSSDSDNSSTTSASDDSLGALPIGNQSQPTSWNWSCSELQPQQFVFVGGSGIKAAIDQDSTELAIFQEFVTHDLLSDIAHKTKLYSAQYPESTSSRKHDLPYTDTTAEELKVVLATTVMMGVIRKPEMTMYWSRDGMLETPFFPKTIPRDRFLKILSNMHFNNIDLDDRTDRLFKIRPMLDAFNSNFKMAYTPEKSISIDESLLKFHGRLKFRQYNPSKRSRFGLKLYHLCQSRNEMCGYTWNLKLYSGQDKDGSMPASTKVVLDSSEDLLGKGYIMHLDNWYSSPNLFHILLQQKIHVVETVMLSRKNTSMPSKFPGKKLKKGDHTFETANEVMALNLER